MELYLKKAMNFKMGPPYIPYSYHQAGRNCRYDPDNPDSHLKWHPFRHNASLPL